MLELDPGSRTARVQPGVVLDYPASARRGARTAVRTRPVHPGPLHPRRDDRQRRLRSPRGQPGAGQRQRALADAWSTAPGRRSAGGHRFRRPSPSWPTSPTDILRCSAPNSADSAGRYRATSLEHLLPERERQLARRSRPRGQLWPAADRGHRQPGRGARRRRHLTVLGYSDMPAAADDCWRCYRWNRWRSRAWTPPGRCRASHRGERPFPIYPAAVVGCSSRPAATPSPKRWPRPRLCQCDGECAGQPVVTSAGPGGASAVADAGRRSGTWRANRRKSTRVARLGRRGRAAGTLGEYLRDFEDLKASTACRACHMVMSVTAASTPDSICRSPSAQRFRAFLRRRRRRWSSGTVDRCPGSTAMASPRRVVCR